ncbi:MAG: VPDSG-CTERM sorting domain-containing protein, partial [Verrucomicrobiota bacterium]
DQVVVGTPLAVSGDYTGTSGASVTVNPFIWNPPGASTPITPLWTFTTGGKTYSFDLSVLHVDFAAPTGLFLSGIGTAHLTGIGVEKMDTTGSWNFSAQTMGSSTFTFSSTTEVPISVPDGGSTMILLGSGLGGIFFLRSRSAPLQKLIN